MRLLTALAFAAVASPAFAQTPITAAPPADASAAIAPATAPAPGPPPRVSLLTTEGEVIIELNALKAPQTVDNFLRYVKDGHYNGTIFHRVIPGFMVQGGGYDASLAFKPTREPIQNEASNGLANGRGTLAMARTQDPHSASAQFFVNLVNNGFLNYQSPGNMGYTVFGKVVQGMEVIDKIAAKPTQNKSPEFANLPTDYIVIQKAEQLPTPVAVIAPTITPVAAK